MGSLCKMFSKCTSGLTFNNTEAKKGRGVYDDNKAGEYRVWLTTYLYRVALVESVTKY